ncbi:MAG: MATE family efflux transporter [Acidobacteria bacterium]|nr:MAG: MATE family efflux transporter [Acidobacteriota bacterium]
MSRSAFRNELAAAGRLAVPVVISQLGMMLMGVIDTMMLGHLSARALAAGALGHILTFCLMNLGYGILSALDPLVSQAHGAEDARAIGGHLQRGLVMAAALTVPIVPLLLDVRPFLRLLGQAPEVSSDTAAFARGILWGILPYFLFVALRQTLQAMSHVRPAVMAIVVGNVCNLAFNWILIFGHLGAPALGVRGSALSTSISRWVMFLYLLIASRRWLRPYWRGFTAEATALRGHLRMLRIGVPIGFHSTVELLLFATAAVLIGQISVTALAGHQIAINLAALTYMVPVGISGAAATRVGNAIGRRDPAGARLSAEACLAMGAGAMLGFAILFLIAPGPLARLYTNDAEVIAMVRLLLPIAAAFLVFDGLQVVSSGVLRGAADTTFPAAMALIGYWALGLPTGWILAFRAGLGARGLWWGFTVGLGSVALLLLLRIAVRFRHPLAGVDAEAGA